MPDNATLRRFFLDRVDTGQGSTGPGRKRPLGIGRLIADCFAIFARKLPLVLLIGFMPSLAGVLVSGALVGIRHTIGLEEAPVPDASSGLYFLTGATDLLVFATTTALLVQVAVDTRLGRPLRFRRALLAALAGLGPISVLSLAQAVLLVLAALPMLLFVVFSGSEIVTALLVIVFAAACLWVYSVWCVMPAAIVIDRAGFRGLGRSAALTKGYRWAVLATILPVWVCSVIVVLAAAALSTAVESVAGLPAAVLVYAVANAVGTCLVAILISLVFLRLREIKEGFGIDQIADVFD